MHYTILNLAFLAGWDSKLVEGKLVISKAGAPIILSLIVNEDFSWAVYHHRQCVNKEYCSILKDMPFELNTGSYIYIFEQL